MPEEVNNIDGRPAIKTDEPMSIQEANVWALEQRDKADARKAAIERLRCQAAKRRERKSTNPLEALKPNPSYRVREFNAEADAFNVDSSDGKKLLGQSLSNGNVRSGQEVRSFFAPDGKVVIDVKPKGRDIAIPKPQAKPRVDEPDIWPCTVAFLYSRIKPNQENLRDNFATDKTSWDYGSKGFSGTTPVNLFYQRADTLGDYETAEDALTNNLKADRRLSPGGSGAGGGGGADNAAWSSGSADAVRVWFYIGEPIYLPSIATTSKIFNVSGPPSHPFTNNVTSEGPGYCLVIRGGGLAYSAIFPYEPIGAGPLTRQLKNQFPNLGGKIGYWGGIAKWRGVGDFTGLNSVSYFRLGPIDGETYQEPTSFPPSYNPATSPNPWNEIHSSWFQFGWGTDATPMYIGCICSTHVNVEPSVVDGIGCGDTVPSESWYWGGSASPYNAVLDKYIQGWDGRSNVMYVCWEGHRDNIGLAQSFFEAFRVYWGLPGSVTKLATCGRYGCAIPAPGGGSTYPTAPPSAPRFLVEARGRKAELWLKVCRQADTPVEIKLPLEFAAVVEQYNVVGNASFDEPNGPSTVNRLRTYGGVYYGIFGQFFLENPHATLSIDGEFAYVNVSYGGERIWEDPLTFPIPTMLSNLGLGSKNEIKRCLGQLERNDFPIFGEYISPENLILNTKPRYVKDCFSYCQAFKIQLPTKETKELVIVESHRYTRGEPIALTSKSPDTEFDQKYTIFDFRTQKAEDIAPPPGLPGTIVKAPWQNPNIEYVGFGGLPALIQRQFPGFEISPEIVLEYMPKFYKLQDNWTNMDWLHFQLQESPRVFSWLSEILPPNVFLSINASSSNTDNLIFDLDGKFGRSGRAEKISNPSSFGHINGIESQTYSNTFVKYSIPFLTSFKEQLIGNGLIENGTLKEWYRISPSSFPIDGQAKRNLPMNF